MTIILSKNEIDKIKQEYIAGDSLETLAQRYYVCKPCIRDQLIKAGIQLRTRGGNNNPKGIQGAKWR